MNYWSQDGRLEIERVLWPQMCTSLKGQAERNFPLQVLTSLKRTWCGGIGWASGMTGQLGKILPWRQPVLKSVLREELLHVPLLTQTIGQQGRKRCLTKIWSSLTYGCFVEVGQRVQSSKDHLWGKESGQSVPGLVKSEHEFICVP